MGGKGDGGPILCFGTLCARILSMRETCYLGSLEEMSKFPPSNHKSSRNHQGSGAHLVTFVDVSKKLLGPLPMHYTVF